MVPACADKSHGGKKWFEKRVMVQIPAEFAVGSPCFGIGSTPPAGGLDC